MEVKGKTKKENFKTMEKGNLLHFPLKNKMSIMIDLKHVYQSQWSLDNKKRKGEPRRERFISAQK